MLLRALVFPPLLAAGLVAGTAAFAQTSSPPPGPATPPRPGPNSGTAPGNEGSTGWTGGTGGSFTGTSPHAPTPGSPTQQPPTVQGLDPRPENQPPQQQRN